jgi:MFS family permease
MHAPLVDRPAGTGGTRALGSAAVARFLVDLAPLRENAQFRRLWFGYAINQLGSQLTTVGVAYQIYRLTGSSLDVGLIALGQLAPSIIGPIVGGALADAIDRRTVLLFTNLGGALCTLGLALNASSHAPAEWLVFVLAAVSAGFAGADNPARTAMMISAFDLSRVVQVNALRTLLQQIALVAGPAIGGVMLASAGLRWVFWADLISFAVVIVTVFGLERRPQLDGGTRFGLRSIGEGLAFLKGRQAIQGCFIADLNANILGMPTALFPAIGLDHLHGGAQAVGLLYAAPGAGAFVGAVFSGWSGRVRRQGAAVLIAVTVWGVSIVAFGLTKWLWAALLLLVVAGAADVVSAVFRGSILQQETTDRLRGRLSSIQTAVVQSGPRLGNTEAGVVAALAGTTFSVVSGGLGVVIGVGLMSVLMPRFARYERPVAETVLTAD